MGAAMGDIMKKVIFGLAALAGISVANAASDASASPLALSLELKYPCATDTNNVRITFPPEGGDGNVRVAFTDQCTGHEREVDTKLHLEKSRSGYALTFLDRQAGEVVATFPSNSSSADVQLGDVEIHLTLKPVHP
jgi:hypothetical protein